MNALLRLAPALALIAAACSNPPAVREWSGEEQPPRLTVQNIHLRQPLRMAPNSAALSAADAGALRAFTERQRLEPRDLVLVAHAPPRTPAERNLADARSRAVGRALAQNGHSLVDLRQSYDPALPRNAVELRVSRAVVQLPACGNWTRPPNANFANGPGANFGCATMSNLGAMVANPADLVGGQPNGPAYGEHAVPAVQRYNRGQVIPLADSATSSIGGGGGSSPSPGPSSGGQQ